MVMEKGKEKNFIVILLLLLGQQSCGAIILHNKVLKHNLDKVNKNLLPLIYKYSNNIYQIYLKRYQIFIVSAKNIFFKKI